MRHESAQNFGICLVHTQPSNFEEQSLRGSNEVLDGQEQMNLTCNKATRLLYVCSWNGSLVALPSKNLMSSSSCPGKKPEKFATCLWKWGIGPLKDMAILIRNMVMNPCWGCGPWQPWPGGSRNSSGGLSFHKPAAWRCDFSAIFTTGTPFFLILRWENRCWMSS